MSERTPDCRPFGSRLAAVLGLLLAATLLAGLAVAATGPLPAGETDDTPTVDFAAGSAVTAANVSYGTPGDVETVTVDLAGGADGTIAPDVVEAVTVVASSGGTPVAVNTTGYGAHGTTVTVGATDVDRLRVIAHTTTSAADGAQVDALLTLSNGTATAAYDTGGVQTVTGDTGFATGRVSDQDNLDVANATVIASRDGVSRRTTTDAEGDYSLELAPGIYDLRVEKRYYSTGDETVDVVANKTTSRNVVVTRQEGAVRLVVTPENATVRANGEDAATFTVTALDALGRPVEGVRIVPEEPFPAFDSDPVEAVTGEDGQATFAVTSTYPTTTAFIVLSFEGSGDDDPRPTGSAEVTFVGEVDPAIEAVSAPGTVTASEPFALTATLHNLGSVPVTDDAVLRLDVDGDGFDAEDPAARRTIEYAAGERVNVTLTIPGETTATLDGSVDYRLATKDDAATGTVTVEPLGAPDPVLNRFDSDGDGAIGSADVLAAVSAYNADEPVGGAPVTAADVLALISRYNEGGDGADDE